MTFLNPFFLFGLAAASLPVLFHFFAQRRARRVEFSSIRFLQKLEKTSMRNVKIRQLLLLIVRTLLVIALVLAFARPALRGYLGGFFGASHAHTSLVLLIDNSASMSRSDEHGVLLKQAKDAALEVAKLMEDGDEALVIPLASVVHGKEYAPVHSQKEVVSEINQIAIADCPAELSTSLVMASAPLAKSLNLNKEVYLFSDNQARNLRESEFTLDSTQSKKVKADSNTFKLFGVNTRFFVKTIGSGEKLAGRNLAIDSLKPVTTVFEPGRPVEFDVWVRNTTDASAENVTLSLFSNEERVAQRTIKSISGNTVERVAIEAPSHGSGLVSIRAELESDALPFDNTRYTVITIPVSRRIGIFMQNPADARFIELALAQSLGTDRAAGGATPIMTETKRIEDLRSLAASGDHYDAIMVGIGGSGLAAPDLSALHDFVASGHGAALFVMPFSDIAKLNSEDLPKLGLPHIVAKEGTANEQTHYLGFAQFDFAHPFFAGMFEAASTSGSQLTGIASPKFYESYKLEGQKGLTLIKLSNGSPYLIEVTSGKGKILFYAAPPTLAFSDFPRTTIFLPLMRRTAAYASSIRSQRDESIQPQFVTTEPLDVELPPLTGERPGSTVLVKASAGAGERAVVKLSADGHPLIHVESAKSAGNYTVYRDAEAREPVAEFAVNIRSDESDLKSASSGDLDKYLQDRSNGKQPVIHLSGPEKSVATVVTQSRYGVELWQSFLWAALILGLTELLIAREARSVIGTASHA